jgi:hypothetical protein
MSEKTIMFVGRRHNTLPGLFLVVGQVSSFLGQGAMENL